MEYIRNHRDFKLVTPKARRNYLMSESNYHTTKFSDNLLAIGTERTEIPMNKPFYLGLSILEMSKILIYKFLYDYVKPKYGEKAKLCCRDKDSFIVSIKPEDICVDIAEGFETRFNTSDYELHLHK